MEILSKALDRVGKGEIAALCIVIDKVGSAPRDPGSLMIVMSNGEKMGQ